jgi:hypothetical protein
VGRRLLSASVGSSCCIPDMCVIMFETEVCGVNDSWSTAVEGSKSQMNVDGVKKQDGP